MQVGSFITGLLLCTAVAVATAKNPLLPVQRPRDRSFVVYSPAVALGVSEVHNRPTEAVDLPKHVVDEFADGNSSMMITNYSFDVVTIENGVERQVPLYDLYNHHYILYMGSKASMKQIYDHMRTHDPVSGGECWHEWHQPNTTGTNGRCRLDLMGSASSCLTELQKTETAQAASFGGAAGGEMRHNPQAFPYPYGISVPNPEQLIPVLHFINTQNSSTLGSSSRLLQCPCTSERVFNYANGTIDGCLPSPPFKCNAWFNATGNPGCFLDKYTSGYRCCGDGVFLEPTAERLPPSLVAYAKMTFHYRAVPTRPGIHRTYPSLNRVTLDVTATPDSSNVEYTVPQCPDGWPVDGCKHVASNVQRPLGSWTPPVNLTHMELVQAAGHVHTGAISLQLIDHKTGQLLCDAKLRYGESEVAGEEAGYLVGIEPCVFDPPIKIFHDTELRTVATYNSTRRIDGVMSLWFLQMSTPANFGRT